MKRIVSLFLLSLLPFLAIAQEESLQVNNDALIWQVAGKAGQNLFLPEGEGKISDLDHAASSFRSVSFFRRSSMRRLSAMTSSVHANMSGVSR